MKRTWINEWKMAWHCLFTCHILGHIVKCTKTSEDGILTSTEEEIYCPKCNHGKDVE